jgi:hypothetical protein
MKHPLIDPWVVDAVRKKAPHEVVCDYMQDQDFPLECVLGAAVGRAVRTKATFVGCLPHELMTMYLATLGLDYLPMENEYDFTATNYRIFGFVADNDLPPAAIVVGCPRCEGAGETFCGEYRSITGHYRETDFEPCAQCHGRRGYFARASSIPHVRSILTALCKYDRNDTTKLARTPEDFGLSVQPRWNPPGDWVYLPREIAKKKGGT